MIRKRVTYGLRYCAVEHADNGQFFFLQLKRKKKELVPYNQGSADTFDTLISEIQGQKHIYLIVNNEQVLTKKVSNTHTTSERLVKMAFPNISLSDFYYKIYTNENDAFVAISRKIVIDDIIEQYAARKISVVNFSLGSLSLEKLTDFIEEDSIHSSNASLSFQEGKITKLEKWKAEDEEYTINDLKVSNNHVLSLAGIIDYYSGRTSDDEVQKQLQKEYNQKRFFDLGFKFALGFLFCALLINFLVFSNYQNKDAAYTSELQINGAKKKELTSLKDLVSRKRTLVESISTSSNSRAAWYFNEIGASVPTTILLSSIHYQPVQGTIKENKRVRFDENKIAISGVSIYDKDFTGWIASLERKSWIDEVLIINYGRGKKVKSSFDLIITLNE